MPMKEIGVPFCGINPGPGHPSGLESGLGLAWAWARASQAKKMKFVFYWQQWYRMLVLACEYFFLSALVFAHFHSF